MQLLYTLIFKNACICYIYQSQQELSSILVAETPKQKRKPFSYQSSEHVMGLVLTHDGISVTFVNSTQIQKHSEFRIHHNETHHKKPQTLGGIQDHKAITFIRNSNEHLWQHYLVSWYLHMNPVVGDVCFFKIQCTVWRTENIPVTENLVIC